MERVHGTVGVDGAAGGDERLRGDLPAEDALGVLVGAEPAEQVDLEHLELEQVEQVVQR